MTVTTRYQSCRLLIMLFAFPVVQAFKGQMYPFGGQIQGLDSGRFVTIKGTSSDIPKGVLATFEKNGKFYLNAAILGHKAYTLEVAAQPKQQLCAFCHPEIELAGEGCSPIMRLEGVSNGKVEDFLRGNTVVCSGVGTHLYNHVAKIQASQKSVVLHHTASAISSVPSKLQPASTKTTVGDADTVAPTRANTQVSKVPSPKATFQKKLQNPKVLRKIRLDKSGAFQSQQTSSQGSSNVIGNDSIDDDDSGNRNQVQQIMKPTTPSMVLQTSQVQRLDESANVNTKYLNGKLDHAGSSTVTADKKNGDESWFESMFGSLGDDDYLRI